jgi:integrase
LRQHRSRQLEERLLAGEHWEDADLVFCTRLGRPLIARNVVRHFKAALRRAALLEQTRFYDLRHSCATLLRAQGVDLLVISRILGHSQLSTTSDIYTHVLPPAMREAADTMDALLHLGDEAPASEAERHLEREERR